MIPRYFYAIVKRIYAILKLTFLKIFNPARVSFGLNQSLSLSTVIRVYDGGKIKLGNNTHTNGHVELSATNGGG